MCDRFRRKFDVQTSYKPSNYVLRLIFVMNIKFPRATYDTRVPSTEELYCLIRVGDVVAVNLRCITLSIDNALDGMLTSLLVLCHYDYTKCHWLLQKGEQVVLSSSTTCPLFSNKNSLRF